MIQRIDSKCDSNTNTPNRTNTKNTYTILKWPQACLLDHLLHPTPGGAGQPTPPGVGLNPKRLIADPIWRLECVGIRIIQPGSRRGGIPSRALRWLARRNRHPIRHKGKQPFNIPWGLCEDPCGVMKEDENIPMGVGVNGPGRKWPLLRLKTKQNQINNIAASLQLNAAKPLF